MRVDREIVQVYCVGAVATGERLVRERQGQIDCACRQAENITNHLAAIHGKVVGGIVHGEPATAWMVLEVGLKH